MATYGRDLLPDEREQLVLARMSDRRAAVATFAHTAAELAAAGVPTKRVMGMVPRNRQADPRQAAKAGGITALPVPPEDQIDRLLRNAETFSFRLIWAEKEGFRAAASSVSMSRSKDRLKCHEVVEDPRLRVQAKFDSASSAQPLLPGFSEEDRRQLTADRRHWEKWLANVDGDLARKPQRITNFYRTKSPAWSRSAWPICSRWEGSEP